MQLKFIGILGLIFVLTANNAQAQTAPTKDLKPALAEQAMSLNTLIAQVWSGGYWEDNDRRGHIRFIVTTQGFERVTNQLFVQWIEQIDGTDKTRLLEQASITEVNDLFYVFGVPQCIGSPQCTNSRLALTHTYTYETSNLNIHLTGVGSYKTSFDQ